MRTKLELGLGAALLIFLGVFAYHWHKDLLEQAVAEAKTQIIDTKMAEREAAWKADRQQIIDLIKNTKTPQQVIQQIPKVVSVPQPIYIAAPEQKAGTVPLPDAPSAKAGDAVVPQASVKPLFDALGEGQACKLDLAKCAADKKDLQAELDIWKTKAKGGSKFQRTMSTIGKVAVGVGIGYALPHPH